MDVYFILVEPAVPENVGASARAIKTMGFKQMRLVDPCNHLQDEAKWLAHASVDILENAQVFLSFEDAIKDIDFIVGTTAKKRSVKYDYYKPDEVVHLIENKEQSIKKVAIVFGREESGLSNEELEKCDILTSIPLKAPYPSLNLSQAVMLFAYSLSSLNIENNNDKVIETDTGSFKSLKSKVSELINKLELNDNISSRLMERLNLISSEDINLMHSFLNKLNENIKKM